MFQLGTDNHFGVKVDGEMSGVGRAQRTVVVDLEGETEEPLPFPFTNDSLSRMDDQMLIQVARKQKGLHSTNGFMKLNW